MSRAFCETLGLKMKLKYLQPPQTIAQATDEKENIL